MDLSEGYVRLKPSEAQSSSQTKVSALCDRFIG